MKKPAVLIANAVCHGKGKDRYKYITGVSKETVSTIPAGISILVHSNTNYQGQQYKLAVYNEKTKRWIHRQINIDAYRVVAVITA